MVFDLLNLICGNPSAVDYFDLLGVKWEMYTQFVEAYYAKCKVRQL
jgi:hypothetical protein